jgi:ABC-type branched-subunit amino acid transport system ATPase component
MSMLAVQQATRRFAGLVAVDTVSFAMREGEILSLIGPNGAGKTTLFNLISGQLKPTSGTGDQRPAAASPRAARDWTHVPDRKAPDRLDRARERHGRRVPASPRP